MKIEIYNDDKLQTISELLVSFYLTTAIPDNRLKKPVVKKSKGRNIITFVDSDEYKQWKSDQSQTLILQGFKVTNDAKMLYSGPVAFIVKYHAKQTLKGKRDKRNPDLANCNKAVHDLVQWTEQKGFGFFIQDDAQIMSAIVVNDMSVPEGRIDCEIWKLKDRE
jgi:Holliday junction resolvase RusA-like endonuclease